MAAAPDRPTRFAADLVEAAAIEGALHSRSGKQQLDHWARLGRAIDMQSWKRRRLIDAAIHDTRALAALSDEERAVANAEIDAAIEARALGTAFGPVLAELGITTVAVDGHGAIVKHYPDGRVETIGQA